MSSGAGYPQVSLTLQCCNEVDLCREERWEKRKGGGSHWLRSFRPPPGPECRFHAEALGHAFHPGLFPERATSLHTHSERFQFRGSLRTIHPRYPVSRSLHGPVTEPRRQLGISLIPPPEAGPLPVFRLCHQLRPERIAFDVARDGEEVFIGLHRKRFEPALINRAGARGVVMRMPALRMRDGNPAEDFRKFPVLPGPEEQVPMIRHEAIGGNADLSLGVGLGENLFKGGVVSGCLKERESPDAAIQDVIGEVAGGEAWTARHG